jgi:hypothetical protein
MLTAEGVIKRIAAECAYISMSAEESGSLETGRRSCAPVWRAISRDRRTS